MNTKPPFSAEMTAATLPQVQCWRLTGKMMGGNCCYQFLETVRENIGQGQIHPILDLKEVSLANSTGLGVLASIFTSAKDAGGAMHLVGVNQRIETVLKVINLWYVVSTHPTVEDALEHLGQG